MTLLVRDEEDIIVTNLTHHLEAGVDHVYVTDNRSIDSTRDLLRPFERSGAVSVIEERSDDYAQSTWVSRMARAAARDGADWVINSDADEFWWPSAGGSLLSIFEALPSDIGMVKVERSDFPPIEPRPLSTPFWELMVYRKARSTNALGRPLPPKVAHVAHPDVSVAQGNHRVEGLGDLSATDQAGLEILHFPIRGVAQFTNKIVNGGRAYERNPSLDARVGATWRHLYEEYLEKGLEDRYASEAVRAEDIPDLVRDGELIEDTRFRERMRALTSGDAFVG